MNTCQNTRNICYCWGNIRRTWNIQISYRFCWSRCNSSTYRIWSKSCKRSFRICKRSRLIRCVHRWSKSKRWRNSSSNILRIFSIFNCKAKNKKTIKYSERNLKNYYCSLCLLLYIMADN